MSMTTGEGRGGHQADINMTPMIDILLVLLIIFLVIQPTMMEAIRVTVPAVRAVDPADVETPLVLEVAPGPAFRLSGVEVPPAELLSLIQEALAAREADATLFIQADESMTYGEVVAVVDRMRAAGVDLVGIVPRSAVVGE